MRINNRNRSDKRGILLGWFILLSVLAHGLFLTMPVDKPDEIHYVSLSSTLQVTIASSRSHTSLNQEIAAEAAEKETATSHQQSVLARQADALALSVKTTEKSATGNKHSAGHPEPETSPVKRKKSAKISGPGAITQTFTEASKSNTATASEKNVPLNHLRQQLKEAIKTRFTYPRIARRMGWEGLVGLSFHIENDGSLNKIRIARSSGHKILDENARKTIQGIGRIQVASNLQIQPVDTEIEVLYRLAD
jgi:TonB family protein